MFRNSSNPFHRASLKAVALCAVCLVFTAAPPSRSASGKAYLRPAPETIPIRLSAAVSGSQVTVSVTVQSVPTGGGSVYVNTSNNAVISNPNGSWPYTLNFPDGGSTTQSVTFTLSSSASGSITIGSCETDYDPTNPANWQASQAITVNPGN